MSQSPVDDALAELLSLDDMEVAGHREVYERIHQQLRRELESDTGVESGHPHES